MRLLLIILLLLTAALQYPLWWGKGGWSDVRELRQRIGGQEEVNKALEARNDALLAEVQDLDSGKQAVEERARGELGMIAPGEVFVQIIDAKEPMPVPQPQASVKPKPPARPAR